MRFPQSTIAVTVAAHGSIILSRATDHADCAASVLSSYS